MRQVVLHVGAVVGLALSGPVTPLYSQVSSSSLQFDFSSGRTPPQSGYVLITPSSLYSGKQSFGLLTEALTPVEKPGLVKALGPAAADGLANQGAIDFRVDLPKGNYAVEIVMDGGQLETWRGEISINGRVLATTLESFGYSAESEYAPPYWACLRKFETDVNHAVLRVHATGQRTAVNSVSFYPYAEGPVRYAHGIFLRTSSARAPNFDLALKLINAGKVTEATRVIDAIPEDWAVDRAHLLMALASSLETQTPRQFVESASAILAAEYARSQDQTLRLQLHLAELYLRADQHYKQAGWQWARDLNGMGIFGNCEISGVCSSEVTAIPQHPLWRASAWQLARTCYWLWVEQHVHRMIVRSDSLFKLIQQTYPDHPVIKAYLADPVQSVADVPRSPDAPRWAELQNALVNRLKGVVHYWCERRQGDNGEFGGKYDDDVEMLRWWSFACVAIDDSLTLFGMKRLVDGIWSSDWISNGWCRRVRDVEHSSEPVADTQPMMIGFDYGNPTYVERCMQSVKLALELWTARNSHGHRHFKSSWYSSSEVDVAKPKDCDVSYNTRTVKAIRWFAWYTRHPEALRFLREWADSWLEDCMRTDKEKPRGVVPAAIRFSDDAIGGHADNWHHPGMFWNYYDYDGGSDMLLEFLSCYQLFGDPKYLKPIEMALALVQKHATVAANPTTVGSDAWTADILRRSSDFWDAVEVWRLLTGDKKFDALLSQNGSPYLNYRLTADKGAIERRLTALLRDLDRNYPLLTNEAYFTDRVVIRSKREQDNNGGSLLESMYLGAPLANLFYPFSAVFWKNTDSTTSVLVEESLPTSLRIRVFNHSTGPKSGNATFLQLEPGEYDMVQGDDENNDGEIDRVKRRETYHITQRNTSCSFTFAPRTEEIIVLRQRNLEVRQEQTACDLAITAAELKVAGRSDTELVITIPVHNIGTADATDITVGLSLVSEIPVIARQATIRRINAPLDLLPKQEPVSFRIPNRPGHYVIRVAGRSDVPEITHVNNSVEFTL